MKCKDIPDDVFVTAVRNASAFGPVRWRTRWEVAEQLEAAIGPIPENLFMAKARRLIARGLIGGCPCGCRGDFHPADECYDPERCCRPED
ncbi:hypothetical protein [Streptomyces sp. IBSNAI001]|uniref:hypothetical protein n=1 Tax=Streptomyces sp. IBSNAI001 TaxID=3457499 RepID=UPI003FD49DBF